MSGVNWDYYNNYKFNSISEKYLPDYGEGDTMAEQIITAVSKLVYKYYNDGDVYDNTHYIDGFGNDLTTYANWLHKYAKGTAEILDHIDKCFNMSDYENLLKSLVDLTYNEDYLKDYQTEKTDSIYSCTGKFRFIESFDDDEWY